VLTCLDHAMRGWPAGGAPLVQVPVAERWRWAAGGEPATEDGRRRRLPLWRGGGQVADDARASAVAFARLHPAGLALVEVDASGAFGAFDTHLPALARLLDPTAPPTVAAVDAADDGPPWLTLTLAAVTAAVRVAVVLPLGAEPGEVAPAGSAFAALLDRRPDLTCHVVV